MDLEALARRLELERGTRRSGEEVLMVDLNGATAPVLSLNWDEDRGCWLLIADVYEWEE